MLDELRLVLAALQAPPRHELDLASARRARRAAARGSPPRARRRPSRPRASSTLTGSGGSCFTPGALRPDEDVAADVRARTAHDLAHGRREDVDAAHDQHVVGAPDAAHARAGAAAAARARPHLRRGRACGSAAAARRGAGGASARARRWRRRPARPRAPVSGSISSAWTKPRAPRCMPSCSSHSPQSDTPMSPMPIASVTRAPQPSSSFARKAGSPPPGSPATSTRSTLDAAQVEAALGRPLDEVGGVGGRQHGRLGLEQLDRAASAARCCRCRPGCGRGRCGRTRRAPRRPRTARRCRSRRCAGRRATPEAA